MLLGAQRPRIRVVPDAPSSAAPECIEFCDSVGLDLDVWQRDFLIDALGERVDGSWSAFEVGLCVPRQNGKSALAEARMLSGLFVLDEELIVYTAHQFDTALEMMRRLEVWLEAAGEPFKTWKSTGKEAVELATGQRVKFRARTAGGGRGYSGDCVILDEAMILDSASIGALMPTMSARPNAQLWYLGSAVDQEVHDRGYVFSSVRKRALARTSPRLCYGEWSAPDGADPGDPASRAAANPAYGRRITAEYVEDEFQALIHTPKIFAVERLGIGDWPELSAAETPPIAAAVWSALGRPDATLESVSPCVIAVDRTPQSRVWSVAGAQRTTDGAAHVELGYNDKCDVTDMVSWLTALVADADPVALVIDRKSPAIVLEPYLVAAGIEPVITDTGEYIAACAGFLEAVDAGLLSHTGQPALTEAVAGTLRKDMTAGFVWRAAPGATIAPSVAATLAHWALLKFGRPRRETPAPMTTPDAGPTHADLMPLAEFDAMSAAF